MAVASGLMELQGLSGHVKLSLRIAKLIYSAFTALFLIALLQTILTQTFRQNVS